MRQQTIVKTYYQFNELDEKQQEKIIEKYYDINVSDEYWYEYTKEEFETKLKKLGFYNIKVQFSGFYNQGDGASFSAKHRRGDVTDHHRYFSMKSDNEVILEVANRLATKFYKQLNAEYDYLTSREAIIETIEANEMEFEK